MTYTSYAGIALLGLLLPSVSGAQTDKPLCAWRYSEAFTRLPALGLRNLDPGRAATEVQSLFGPRPEVCEPGAYERFIDAFRDYAREAMRAPMKERDGMIRVAIYAAQQGPRSVPFEEAKAALSAYRKCRSDLHATADDVGITPLMQQLLDHFAQVGAPQPQPPTVQQPAPPGQQPITIRAPQTPLPPWAVISIYEARDLLSKKSYAMAQGKLEAILKWLETAP